MSVISTEAYTHSNWLKALDADRLDLFTEVVTVNEAAQKTYKTGAVLGKVTADGKYKLAVETAVDGSKVGAAIVLGDVSGPNREFTVAATTDTKVLVLRRGKALVSKSGIVVDATYDNATKLGVLYNDLAALNIIATDAL